MSYNTFLKSKSQLAGSFGFKPTYEPEDMFEFQKRLLHWSLIKGRAAIFADCGLGKTFIQLAFAENILRKKNKNVLILTPLAVSHQTVKEGEKFGIDVTRSDDGKIPGSGASIVVTNYERLHYFDPKDFVGVVCDESSILKNFKGATKKMITEFVRLIPYRLLCTATAAPNDYIELGTSSEALGDLGYMDMLQKFFKANDGSYAQGGGATSRTRWSQFGGKFRMKPHAERDFWRWVCSWSRAIRKPSDIGCSDDGFKLPKLSTRLHIVESKTANPELLFDLPAHGLAEQRSERSRTVEERCERAAEIVNGEDAQCVSWCHINREGDALASMIDDSVQVSGSDSDEFKEESFRSFESGEIKSLITKPTIAGFGLNWQHCHRQTFFPSHSFEQYYQAIRRSWRFGQKKPVTIDVISSEGEANVLKNLQRKAAAASEMFDNLVAHMHEELKMEKKEQYTELNTLPKWL